MKARAYTVPLTSKVSWQERCGAFLFTLVGGFLDAYAYIAHGVFANAQTGNVVMLAVNLAQAHWINALNHLVPIVTFSAGVLIVTLLNHRWEEHTTRLRLWSAFAEAAVLGIILLLQARLPVDLVVPMISFAAAVQVTSFGSLGTIAFNSAMTTGNLRRTLTALVRALTGQDVERNRETFLTVGTVVVCFLLGALVGGWTTRYHPAHALAVPLLGVVTAAVLSRVRDRQEQQSVHP